MGALVLLVKPRMKLNWHMLVLMLETKLPVLEGSLLLLV
jgi:hypothetical protein